MTELMRVTLLIASLTGAPTADAVATGHALAVAAIMESAPAGALVIQPAWSGAAAMEPAVPARRDAWFGSDKFQHFWMSYAVTAFAFGGLRAAGADADTALKAALPVAAAAGIGKEVHDRRRGQIFSLRDLVADGLGIAAAYFFLREVR